MNKKELKIVNDLAHTASDSNATAHRALTNTLAFLERSSIQGIKSIELLVESFNFILALRQAVEADMAKEANKNAEVAVEEAPKQD